MRTSEIVHALHIHHSSSLTVNLIDDAIHLQSGNGCISMSSTRLHVVLVSRNQDLDLG